jgi:hypothetical protein
MCGAADDRKLTISVPVPNAWEPQLTQCRAVRTSPASAQVRMKLEGRVCSLPRQLTTITLRWAPAGSAGRLDADAVAPSCGDAQPARKPVGGYGEKNGSECGSTPLG